MSHHRIHRAVAASVVGAALLSTGALAVQQAGSDPAPVVGVEPLQRTASWGYPPIPALDDFVGPRLVDPVEPVITDDRPGLLSPIDVDPAWRYPSRHPEPGLRWPIDVDPAWRYPSLHAEPGPSSADDDLPVRRHRVAATPR